ncbi:hypothetical protein Hte_010281 [Hypoxylon texense]
MCVINQTDLEAEDAVQLCKEELITHPVVTEFKDHVATAIRNNLSPCDGLEVPIEIDEARDIPHQAFWARVDPKEVIPRSTEEWDAAQRRMWSPVMWVYFPKVRLVDPIPKGDGLRPVKEAILQVIDKYAKIYDEGTESYSPGAGLDPRLYIIYLWQFNFAVGPQIVRAVVPPPCIERYNSELAPEGRRDVAFTVLHLDEENDPNRVEWEEDWTRWTLRDCSEDSRQHLLWQREIWETVKRVSGR